MGDVFAVVPGALRRIEPLEREVKELRGQVQNLIDKIRILEGQIQVLMVDFNERRPPLRGRPKKGEENGSS